MDAIKPNYYQLNIRGINIDVFDLVRAMADKRKVSFQEASAIKYIVRIKQDTTEKRINDLEKAIECLSREIEHLRYEKEYNGK